MCECVVDVVARPDSPMVARVTRLDSSHLSKSTADKTHGLYSTCEAQSHTLTQNCQ